MEYEMMKYSFVVCMIQMQTCAQLNVTLKSKQRAALTSGIVHLNKQKKPKKNLETILYIYKKF